MARSIMLLLLLVALILSLGIALRSCEKKPEPVAVAVSPDAGSGLVSLRDGTTMIAEKGTVGRDLVDWFAAHEKGSHTFELGGREFIAGTAEPTIESKARVGRLIAMLNADLDVDVRIIGHTDPSGDRAADQKLSLARAQTLAQFLRDGGIAAGRLQVEGRGADAPIADNGTAAGRLRNQRVSIVLSRQK